MAYRIKGPFEAWGTLACKAGQNGYLGTIDPSSLTASRSYTLPDKDGTFAMLSDIVGGGGIQLSSPLTGFVLGTDGTALAATDTVLGSFQKLQVQSNSKLTADTTQTITGLKSFQQGDNASLGAECIVATADRDFSAAGAWTGTGWSVTSAALAHTAGANAATLPNTALNITPATGVVYVIAMKVITTTLGTLTLSFAGASLGVVAGQWVGTVYVNKYVLGTGATALTVTPDATWVGSIDDVSIKILTRSSYPSMRLFGTTATTTAEVRTLSNTNLGIGNAAHRSNVSGTHNYGLGYYAQAGLTTGIANIGIGTEVQEFLTNGTHNIGVGYFVQNSITSSSYNVGLGGYVQQNLTTGFNNVGMGFEAQRYLTVGWNNVAIGTSAQRVLTTGRGNVGLGYQSQMALTTGDYNMGIGQNCLRNLISGSNNAAIGNNCLYTITTQGNNTGIGTDVLFNCASTDNTGIGYGSLGDLTSGGYNTALGALTGDGATNATITYCSFFGYNARSTTDGITNSTAIGNGAVVTASNQIRLGNSNIAQVVTSGNLIAYAAIIGTQFQSTIPDGTAPITVVSKTLVTNLNADYLNGQQGSYYAPTDQTMYIGTTAVAINRASGALNLTLGGTLSATTGTFSGNITTSGQFTGAGTGLTGSADSLTSGFTNRVNWLGAYAASAPGNTRGPFGLNFYAAYNNGYPTTYGNVLHMVGNGGSQLLLGWSGSDGAHADNYIRSKRDNDTGAWSPWAKLITDVNLGNTGAAIGGTTGTFSSNIETTTAGNGLILKDASNGNRYRIYSSGGTLMMVQI